MFKEFRTAIGMLLCVSLLTGVLYPLLITGLTQVLFPEQAKGSLIRDAQGQVRGSHLLGQSFTGAAWFHSRPSAVDFATLPSGASNLAPSNPELAVQVRQRISALAPDSEQPVPMALVTTSGSGVDPHLPVGAVLYQVHRVAQARQLSSEALMQLIEVHTERPFIGPAVVNVLALNQALQMIGVTRE
ncbi:K+-transporting ATPase ATPase C chain [Azomonas agilis]|uniref:Potassium-transporting ATPase KdpC subunit n=1 Tax=Azomonas agilis TaxID=116849 RepID=A0A562I0Y4_9GAMM|nr:potassium-transporting ATPase subunit KdpC [Azomonas agilis]TWH64612.1 K+-transporting ATPase ATPase C chain [Azomonas agilis]